MSGNRGRAFGFGKADYTHIRYTQTQTHQAGFSPGPREDEIDL